MEDRKTLSLPLRAIRIVIAYRRPFQAFPIKRLFAPINASMR